MSVTVAFTKSAVEAVAFTQDAVPAIAFSQGAVPAVAFSQADAEAVTFSTSLDLSDVLPQAPVTPSGLSADSVGETTATLSANTVSGATGYRLYLGGVEADDQASPSFSLSGLDAGTAYSATVSAYNAAGESAQSAAVEFTTDAASPESQQVLAVDGGVVAIDGQAVAV